MAKKRAPNRTDSAAEARPTRGGRAKAPTDAPTAAKEESSSLIRFGVAMDRGLLGRFDGLLERRGYETRSEALRDLVRRELDQDAWQRGAMTCATITLVYDHHVRELTDKLTKIQHDHGDCIISAMHVHLDHDHCMEVIAVRGPARQLKSLADRLLCTKGVLNGNIVAAAVE